MKEKPIDLSEGPWCCPEAYIILSKDGTQVADICDNACVEANEAVISHSDHLYLAAREAITTRDEAVVSDKKSVYECLAEINAAIEKLSVIVNEIEEAAG